MKHLIVFLLTFCALFSCTNNSDDRPSDEDIKAVIKSDNICPESINITSVKIENSVDRNIGGVHTKELEVSYTDVITGPCTAIDYVGKTEQGKKTMSFQKWDKGWRRN